MRERMALAKGMLINTAAPIGEIALECGFFDASHMSNCFKKREDMTPLEFRHDWKMTI
jgi:transcriptional regulator GlxA family with amidase domain